MNQDVKSVMSFGGFVTVFGLAWTIFNDVSNDVSSDKKHRETVKLQKRQIELEQRQTRVQELAIQPIIALEAEPKQQSDLLLIRNIGDVPIIRGRYVIEFRSQWNGSKTKPSGLHSKTALPALRANQHISVDFHDSWIEYWKEQGITQVAGTITLEAGGAGDDMTVRSYDIRFRLAYDSKRALSLRVDSLQETQP